jgi:hypothetical protein
LSNANLRRFFIVNELVFLEPNRAYKLYTDLAYKAVIGKNAAQVRKERDASKKATAVDYMTADEIERITKVQYQISVLKDMGMDYKQIKALVLDKSIMLKVA